MAIGQYNKVYHFIITQLFSLLLAILYIAILHILGYQVRYFLLCSPILLFLIIIYYFLFWRPQKQLFRCFCLVNLVLLIISSVSYFTVYYGVFQKSLEYILSEVSSCQIIGQMSSNLSGNEHYSILYVNYIKNGRNMLGYACKSNLSEASLFSRIYPADFYFYNSKYPCQRDQSKQQNDISQRFLQNQSRDQDKLNLRKRQLESSGCVDYYTFSEVKLPSWMCISSDTSFEDMMNLQQCYISNYQNNSFGSKDKAQINSLNRKPLKKISSFTIVQFDDMPVPVDYLVLLIIFTFYPFIVSTNIIFAQIAQIIFRLYYKRIDSNNENLEQEQILSKKIQDKNFSKQYSLDSSPEDKKKIISAEQNIPQLEYAKNMSSQQNNIINEQKFVSDVELKQLKEKYKSQSQKINLQDDNQNQKDETTFYSQKEEKLNLNQDSPQIIQNCENSSQDCQSNTSSPNKIAQSQDIESSPGQEIFQMTRPEYSPVNSPFQLGIINVENDIDQIDDKMN